MGSLYNLDKEWGEGLKDKLCQGELADYKPWIDIRSFHSKTTRYRVPSTQFGRCIHLFSHSERQVFWWLLWHHAAKDIKEQYALDPTLTLQISRELGFKHPGYTCGGHVMTTDLVMDYWDNKGSLRRKAVQVKDKPSSITGRVAEKIAIEREYWERSGVEFKLICASELNPVLCNNLQLLYHFSQMALPEESLRFMLNEVCRLKLYPKLSYTDLPWDVMLPPLSPGEQYSLPDAIKLLCAHKVLSFPIGQMPLFKCRIGNFTRGGMDRV